MAWFVYIAVCADDSLYTGITTDVLRRELEHNGSPLGAKYTRVRRPVQVVYQEAVDSRAAAMRREHSIKKLTRNQKKQLYWTADSELA